jgi:hypothetical protein
MKYNSHLYFLILMMLMACSTKPDCIKSSGTVKTEMRYVAPFAYLKVFDNIDVQLKNDTLPSVRIEAGENILAKIITEVDGGNLIVRNNNTCNWVRDYASPVKVIITQPALQTIFQYGSGNIVAAESLKLQDILIHQYGGGDILLNLHAENIIVDLNGIGNVVLTGSAQTLSAHTYNPGMFRFGVLNTSGLACKECSILSESEADAYVSSDSILSVHIRNSGNVYYSGAGKVMTLTKEGAGNVIYR